VGFTIGSRGKVLGKTCEKIIIINMKKKICILTDVAIPSDRNLMQKVSEKKLKYKNLST
jgi:hypothetical protein